METINQILQNITIKDETPLRCAMCNNYLSIAPIVYNDRIGTICGRENCKIAANREGKNLRQKAFEELVKFSVFPCMYKENGCQEKLLWGEIGSHENECRFLKLECPFSTGRFEDLKESHCKWLGNSSDLLALHIKEVHSGTKFEDYLQVRLEDNISKNRLFFKYHEYSIILILLVVDQTNFSYWKVWTAPKIWEDLTYKIEISTESRKILTSSKILKSELIYPGFSRSKIDNSWFKIDLDFMKIFYGVPAILTVKFYQKGFLIDTKENPSLDIATPISNSTCAGCSKIDDLPFICEKMHSICSKCKKGAGKEIINPACCPKCNFKLSMNFDWSKSLKICSQCNKEYTVTYVCEKQHIICNNCQITKNPEKATVDCPKCNSTMNKNVRIKRLHILTKQSLQYCIICSETVGFLSSHILLKHHLLINRLGQYNIHHVPYKHFFSFDDNIFLFSTRINSKNDFVFSVQCLGACDIKYKYELKLIGTTTYSAMTFSNFCYPEFRKLSLDAKEFQELVNKEKDLKMHEMLIPNDVIFNIFPHFNIDDVKFKLDIDTI